MDSIKELISEIVEMEKGVKEYINSASAEIVKEANYTLTIISNSTTLKLETLENIFCKYMKKVRISLEDSNVNIEEAKKALEETHASNIEAAKKAIRKAQKKNVEKRNKGTNTETMKEENKDDFETDLLNDPEAFFE